MASDHLRPVCYSAHIAPERFCEEELKDASVAVASGMTPQQSRRS
jgi:hypothetical protein